jgi:hypothetical protein
MKNKLLMLAVIGLALSGCQTAAFGIKTNEILAAQRPATVAEVNGVVEAMRQHLYDPYSVRDAEISNVVSLHGTPTLCVKANSKNRMGGYVGRQTVMVYLHNNRPFAVNTDVFAQSGCNQLKYRRFGEVERLKSL